MSPPSRAAWIEIDADLNPLDDAISRRLHGRRGLKCQHQAKNAMNNSRRLHGRRGLKYSPELYSSYDTCRRLHGRRGLKSVGGSRHKVWDAVAAFTGGVD